MYRILLVATLFLSLSALVGCSQKQERVLVANAGETTTENKPTTPSVQLVEVGSSQKSVLVEPKVTYAYKLGLMKEKTRTFETVKYPDGPKVVPIINGYVPMVFETIYPNGDRHVVYDYRNKVEFRMIPPARGE
jgi:hypothetical protein